MLNFKEMLKFIHFKRQPQLQYQLYVSANHQAVMSADCIFSNWTLEITTLNTHTFLLMGDNEKPFISNISESGHVQIKTIQMEQCFCFYFKSSFLPFVVVLKLALSTRQKTNFAQCKKVCLSYTYKVTTSSSSFNNFSLFSPTYFFLWANVYHMVNLSPALL